MSEHDSPLIECVRNFAEIKGEIVRVKNGHADQARVLSRMADTMENATTQRRKEHDETVKILHNYETGVNEVLKVQTERLVVVEEASKSAHNRLDGQHKMIWAILTMIMAAAIGVIIKIFGG